MKNRGNMKKSINEKKLEAVILKNEAIINTMERWICLQSQGHNVADILFDFKLMNIAIYGMGHLGKLLYEQLRDSRVSVSYIIDQNKIALNDPVPVYSNNDILPDTDAIIVTAIYYYDNIKNHLEEKNKKITIISLEDILYWN